MKKLPSNATLVLLTEEHSGRDEMNLAGNPFALLQANKTGQAFIKEEWEKRLPNGKIVTAKWEVNGHAELGLPGPQDETVYLVLLQLTREVADKNGEWPEEVRFSQSDILHRLNWPAKPQYYKLLKDCITRLSTVKIIANYAFWDARVKNYPSLTTFGILDEATIIDEPAGRKKTGALPLCHIRWNKTLHQSILAGNVRSLALDFALALDLPTTRRLFRFLDMMRSQTTPARSEFAIGLLKLRARLGMTDYKYASKIKEKLEPAIAELIETGYLLGVDYSKAKNGELLINFVFGKPNAQGRAEQVEDPATPAKAVKTPKKPIVPIQLPFTYSVDEKSGSDSDVQSDLRLDALRCHAIFVTLDEIERNELLEMAKRDVSPIWHDRLGVPESPMSLGLWKLVAEKYPEKLNE